MSSHGRSGVELTKRPLSARTSEQKGNCNARPVSRGWATRIASRRPRMPAESAMGTEPKPKTAKTKRRRAPPEEFVDYIVEIESWDSTYCLPLNTHRPPPHPLHHH